MNTLLKRIQHDNRQLKIKIDGLTMQLKTEKPCIELRKELSATIKHLHAELKLGREKLDSLADLYA